MASTAPASTTATCKCGCGMPAPLAPRTITWRGWVKGEPIPFLFRHVLRTKPVDVRARFESFVQKTEGCWEWLGAIQSSGYGLFNLPLRRNEADARPRQRLAHRFSYELHVGPIPQGLEIDHLCRNRRCVRPGHLEPVTHRENDMRGASPFVVAHREGRCVSGRHEFTPANTRRGANGRGRCRACEREGRRTRRQNAKEVAA